MMVITIIAGGILRFEWQWGFDSFNGFQDYNGLDGYNGFNGCNDYIGFNRFCGFYECNGLIAMIVNRIERN